ncbi:MAG: ABC transporter permease [Candidatus Acidiferrales bacterium]
MNAATHPAVLADSQVPVISITPPNRWWVLPVGELWEYRELLYFFVWRELKVRYKQTVVGAAWAVLQPFLTMLIFSLFFGKLANIPSGGLPYPVFYYSALLPWMYFSSSLQNATGKIVENQNMITKVYFPRLALPISAVISGLVDFAISLLMFVAIMIYYHIHPGWPLLMLPVFLLLAVLTALGVGLWLSALNAIYRDVRYVVPFLVQFWMFASPVVYPSSLVSAKWPKWAWLYGLNPMVGVIEGFRWSLTGTGNPPGRMLLASALAVVAVLVCGVMYFQKMETTIADVV